MIFAKLTPEQEKQLKTEFQKASKANWFRRLTVIKLSRKKVCS